MMGVRFPPPAFNLDYVDSDRFCELADCFGRRLASQLYLSAIWYLEIILLPEKYNLKASFVDCSSRAGIHQAIAQYPKAPHSKRFSHLCVIKYVCVFREISLRVSMRDYGRV